MVVATKKKKPVDFEKLRAGLKTQIAEGEKSGISKEQTLKNIRTRITQKGGTEALTSLREQFKAGKNTAADITGNTEKKDLGFVTPGGVVLGTKKEDAIEEKKVTDKGVVTDEITGEEVVEEPIVTETPEEKTLREQVAARIAGRKTEEEKLLAAREEAGRPELVEQRKQFREEAATIQEDLENIRKGLEAEGGAITKIAASRIREARSAPLREQLTSMVKGIELTSANLKELDQSTEALLKARELDRQQEVANLTAQIEGSSLSNEEKNKLLTQLGQQTARMKREDELELFRQKEKIKADIEAKDADSLAKTGLTAEQNLQAASIVSDFDVKEDSLAGQSIRKLLREGKTPAQIRQILGLAEKGGVIDDETFTRQEKLRKEFESSATVKNYLEATQQFAGVITSLGTATGPGDMASIFAFMKTLDPSSVVRESEFDAASRSIGLGEQAKNFLSGDKLKEGVFLTEKGRKTFAEIAKVLFENRKAAFDERAGKFITLAKEAGANPRSVVLDFDNIPGVATDLTEEDLAPISGDSSDEEIINFIRKGGSTFTADSSDEEIGSFLDFNSADQTASTKVSGILGPLQETARVIAKGGDNPVLGLSGGSLTFRTNNPLAITATGAGTAERLTGKFGAIPNLFSPDSADNLVLNFKTPEEGLRAGRQLLEEKGGLTIDKLMESHTGTAATGHKAQAQKLGIDLSKTYNELTEEEKNKVIEAIKIGEGFRAGTTIT